MAAAPALAGCSEEFWYREPKVAGQIERAPFVGQPPLAGGSVVEEGFLPPPAVRRGIALNPPPLAAAGAAGGIGPGPEGSPDGPLIPPSARQATPPSLAPRAPSVVPSTEDLRTLEYVNRVRRDRSLPELRFNQRLFAAARAHSAEQLQHNFLGHHSLDPERVKLSQRMLAEGYIGRVYAEVVASDFVTVEEVVRAWMDSPTHRQVLLDPELSEGAFSRLEAGPNGRSRWTGDFGAPEVQVSPTPAQPPRTPVLDSRPQALPPSLTPATSTPRPGASAPSSAQPPRPAPPSTRGTGVPSNSAAGSAPRQPAVAGATSRPAPPLAPLVTRPLGPAAGSPSGATAGNAVPPPAVRPAPQPTYVAPPRYYPPVVQPAPVRQPVLIRRPVRRVGDCAT